MLEREREKGQKEREKKRKKTTILYNATSCCPTWPAPHDCRLPASTPPPPTLRPAYDVGTAHSVAFVSHWFFSILHVKYFSSHFESIEDRQGETDIGHQSLYTCINHCSPLVVFIASAQHFPTPAGDVVADNPISASPWHLTHHTRGSLQSFILPIEHGRIVEEDQSDKTVGQKRKKGGLVETICSVNRKRSSSRCRSRF